MARSRVPVGALGLAVVAMLVGGSGSASAVSGSAPRPGVAAAPEHDHHDRQFGRAAPAGTSPRPATLERFRLLGHSGLDGFGDYGDLYAHRGYAYVGSRCGAARQGGDGVQVVDLSRPARPRTVATLPNPAFTRAEDVTVRDVRTPTFTGTIAVVGIQACFGSGHEPEVVPGLRFYDVTRPAHPVLLSHWDLAPGTIGCHEIDAVQRADGAFLAVCARNLVDHERSAGATAIQLVDATAPAAPRAVGAWTLGLDPDSGVGCLSHQFSHSARFTDRGTALWVSYWDAGTVHLDVTDPAAPAVVSSTKILPLDEDGDNHSMTLANGGKWLIINTEDFSPGDCPGSGNQVGGWGEVYVYDNSTPAQPTFLGTFSTGDSRSSRTDGDFTDHNTEVFGSDQFFSSWYAGGVVWWTMNDQGVSRQLGRFVPPTAADGSLAEIWGVSIDPTRHLIVASDIRGGLWIIQPTGLAGF
ncbi:MAG TPA: hypothetical protein VMU51_17005 [Mycobacteriales bacterium]|nr:hypothetical protein [Mycobacteriales bacterium]